MTKELLVNVFKSKEEMQLKEAKKTQKEFTWIEHPAAQDDERVDVRGEIAEVVHLNFGRGEIDIWLANFG